MLSFTQGGIFIRNVLTIAGSDCSGGAGIQADLKTFAAHGVYGMSVIVSVVAENTCRVLSVRDLEPEMVTAQMDAVFEDIPVHAVKIGMLSGKDQMRAVAEGLARYRPPNVVVDPVMVAKGGCALMHPDALGILKSEVIPKAFLLTPNIPEAETISGMRINTPEDRKRAARTMQEMGAENVLVKGGHLEGDAEDLLLCGEEFHVFRNNRIDTPNTHGTGCTLSSAIAANLANGSDLVSAVAQAKAYITGAIAHAVPLGKGHGPVNHFFQFSRTN